ncbi:hypothetical protein JCM8208_006860 [Rhodotorula glutinis]
MPPRKSTRKRKATQHFDDDYEPAHEASDGEEKGGGRASSDEVFAEPGPSTSKSKKGKVKGPDDSEEEDYAPPKKKTTASKTKTKGKAAPKPRGNRGKLSAFTSMPLDVLALIVSHLDTKTVLACSRTCSSFRTLLHSSQGKSCWKSARFNTSRIPDLEAGDLTEWEYASLLFDGTCHICHKPKAKTVDFHLRVRGCASCMRSNSLRAEKLRGRKHPKALECALESKWSPYEDYGFGGIEQKVYTFYWDPQVRAVSQRLYELDGKPGFDEYVKERKRIKAAAKQDAAKLNRWEDMFARAKDDEAWAVSKRRRDKIEANLLALGYTADEIRGHAVQTHSLYQAKGELTDRAWNGAKAKLVAALDEARAEQRKRDTIAAMKARGLALKPYWAALQSSIPSGDERMLFPPFGNFLVLPSVSPLYEPEDAKPSQEDLQAARGAIMSEAQAFAAEIRSAFVANLVEAHTGARTLDTPLDDVDKLMRLVTSAVACPSGPYCSTSATFPAILDQGRLLAAVNEVEPGKVDAAKTTTAELYALGPEAFDCEACMSQQTAVGPAVWSRALSTKMGWAAMIRHLLVRHATVGQVLTPTIIYTPHKPPSDDGDAPAADTASGGFVVDADES